jgi:hypothetical protein
MLAQDHVMIKCLYVDVCYLASTAVLRIQTRLRAIHEDQQAHY